MGAPGSVISLVTPGDVWVVDKLARRLGVPIQEAHVADGKLHPGPPPKKADAPGEDGPSTSKGSAMSSSSSSSSSSKAGKGLTSSSPSPGPATSPSSPRASKASPFGAAALARHTPQQRAGAPSSSGRAGTAEEERAGKGREGPRAVRRSRAEDEYEVIVDDEDELEVEEEEEEEGKGGGWGASGSGGRGRQGGGWQGQRGAISVPGSRAARRALKFGHELPPGVPRASSSGGVKGGDGSARGVPGSRIGSRLDGNSSSREESSSSKVKEELMRELAALRAEKELAKSRSSGGAQRKGAKSSS